MDARQQEPFAIEISLVTINPYEAPQESASTDGVPRGSHEDLRSVATYQKGILVCILAYLGVVIIQVFVPGIVGGVFAIGALLTVLAGAVFVFLLSVKLYGSLLGCVFGLLSVIPIIGLFVLLGVSGKATAVLRANGIEVGLLGASLSEV